MYCYIRDAPRLACVKPVASVHPEPGSNSSLLYLISLLFCIYYGDFPGRQAFVNACSLDEAAADLPACALLVLLFLRC